MESNPQPDGARGHLHALQWENLFALVLAAVGLAQKVSVMGSWVLLLVAFMLVLRGQSQAARARDGRKMNLQGWLVSASAFILLVGLGLWLQSPQDAQTPPAQQPQTSPLPVKEIRIARQRDVSPGPNDPPSVREVVIQTTVDIRPTWLRLTSDAPISQARYRVGEGPCNLQGAGEFYSDDRKILWLHFQEPAFTAEDSLTLYLFGDDPMEALSVEEGRPPAGLREENAHSLRIVD